MISLKEQECWQSYSSNKDIALQNALFETYREWAEWLAFKLHDQIKMQGVELEEFEQFAYEGLLNAINHYSLEKNVKFKTFAEHRVKGNILNNLPSISEDSAYYCKRGRYLTDESNHTISVVQLSDPISKLVNMVNDLSIHYFLQEDDTELMLYQGEYYTSPEFHTMSEKIKSLINNLTDPMSGIINSHYQKGWSFSQIADLLDLTRARISQLHQKALKEIKLKLGWEA